jgi:hypothetical protein
MAMEAAKDQNRAEPYLRALREGIFCQRRKLDTPDALTDLAARTGLDVDRFKLDIASNHVVEQFGNDLEIARNVPEAARAAGAVETIAGKERVPFPTMYFTGGMAARATTYTGPPRTRTTRAPRSKPERPAPHRKSSPRSRPWPASAGWPPARSKRSAA